MHCQPARLPGGQANASHSPSPAAVAHMCTAVLAVKDMAGGDLCDYQVCLIACNTSSTPALHCMELMIQRSMQLHVGRLPGRVQASSP